MIQERLFPATGMPDRNWWQALWPDPDGVIKALGIKPGMTVVDLGCGYGYFTAAMARQVGAGHVIGFDLDPKMLDQAQLACEGMTNCEWLLGDAMELSRLAGAPADYVLIANTFHGAPNKTALAREVAAALKPNGRLAIVNWYPLPREETTVLDQPRGPSTPMRMSPKQICSVVEPAGFTLETPVELPPYHYGAVFVRAN
ncbi:class I SAM-dependent methyltransferase [Acidithiobacillus thiooxidans]|uniref:Methyltransferase n=1 Tax=Acidithiobacillus thiooxidans TaxID=930 RepID=A0A1C2IU05_ACITH|nr:MULTISPECIES: class I SAM-dependent methyltransferase [Acidithiobacillus]MBU2835060.1 class I SAM-dependent methyltransferase [Acidithiobacillus thiooxidans]MBU2859121.1 class I SAM-dependent methyltransferase [Acidithiobacillus ferrooxidans]MDA8176775.1 class I SAM-dependent methyltransferase [Acidithiobacillus sp.]OCX74983.1 methyltransferase [Acidithiobacillus thiooxidans]OCX79402.1 methyltransferase [Acidithiobacillus thiooxidans]